MSNLFISHSSADNEAARELQARLAERGHRSVFLDFDPEAGIQAGASWERTLYTKLRACRAVVVLCSETYLASQWCFAEVALARMEGKELFVLQVDPWSERATMPSILTEDQFIDLRTNREEGYRRLWNGFKIKGIVPAEAREWRPEEPPYPGLRAFREQDAPIFFGRDEEIRTSCELLNRVRRQGHPRLIMVLGSSGSGKSSLARAGIVPRLRRDPARWLVVRPFRPGRQPMRELAAALSAAFEAAGRKLSWKKIHDRLVAPGGAAPAAPTTESPPSPATDEAEDSTAKAALLQALRAVEQDLPDSEQSVVFSIRRLETYIAEQKGGAPGTPSGRSPEPAVTSLAELAYELRFCGEQPESTVVLTIDQFEELLGHDAEHPATRFLAILRAAIEEEGSPLLVIGTMRSDYLGVLQRSAPIRGLGFKSISVGPMSSEGMREIIQEPAKLGQIQLEKGLADRLLADTETANALPLLAFTMRMMWDRFHDKRLFEIREYEGFGGLQGAIAQVADETFAGVLERVPAGPRREALAEELLDAFRSMARPAAEGTGWSREAVSWDRFGPEVRLALAPFIDVQRLLVKLRDGTVEVAHEALFHTWHRLRDWLDKDREFILWRNRLRTALSQWQQSGRDEGSLLRGVVLAKAEEWLAERPDDLEEERGFIAASTALRIRQRDRRRRRRRNILAATAAAALVCLGLAGWAFKEQRIAARRAVELHAGLVVRTASTLSDPLEQALLLIESAEILRDREPSGGARTARRVAGRPIPRSVLRGHGGSILDAALSPDDSSIVTASGDGTARVWQGSGAGRVVVLRGHDGDVVSAAFDSRGGRIVTASIDGTARVWNADGSGGAVLLEGHGGSLNTARFSPDGSRIVTASADGTARVWRADGGELVATLRGHSGEVLGARFSPVDGGRVLTVSADRTARLWRPEQSDEGTVIARHGDQVLEGRFSHDGSRIVTASRDNLAKVCRVDGSVPCVELAGHTDWVWSAVFSHDGARVLTASADRSARVWSAEGEGELLVLRGHEDWVRDAAFGPDDEMVVTASHDGRARLWVLATPDHSVALDGHKGWVRRAIFSRDGARVITASDDGTVRVWSSSGPQDALVVARHADQVWTASFSPDDERIVTSSADLTAAIWATDTGRRLAVLRGHTQRVRSAEFSPDGERVATAADDGTARIWEAATAQSVAVLNGHAGEKVLDVNWHSDGSRLVTSSYDKTASVWSVAEEQLAKLRHDGWVRSAVFSGDGRSVLSASADRRARIWNADGSGEPVVLEGHNDQIMTAAFSPDESKIVTSSADDTARIWSATGSTKPISLEGHEAIVWSAAFSPDGSRVVTASQDGTARVWSAEGTGEPVYLEGHDGPVWHAEFSHDGSRIVTASADGTARLWRLWQLDWPALVEDLRQRTDACLSVKQRQLHLMESAEDARAGVEGCEQANAQGSAEG